MAAEATDRPLPLSGLALLALLSLVAAGTALRWSIQGYDARTQDEMVYTRWASMLAREGEESIPYAYLVAEYNAIPSFWRGPSPLRAGYLGLLSLCMSPQGPQNIEVGVRLSIAASALSLLFLALFGFKALGFGPTLLALLLMTVSPLDLLIARRAWQDGILANAVLWLLLSCALVLRKGRLGRAGALGLFAAALWLLLLKESSVLIVGILAACLTGLRWKQAGSIQAAWSPLAAFAAAALAAAGILVGLSGGAQPAWEAYRHCWQQALALHAPNAGILRVEIFEGIPLIHDPGAYQAGPWYGCLAGLFLLSPATILLGSLGILMAAGDWRRNPRRWLEDPALLAMGLASAFTVAYLAMASLRPLSLRLLAPVDLPLHALAGWAGWRLTTRRPWLPAGGLVLAVLAAWSDHRHFLRLNRLKEVGIAKVAEVPDPTVSRVLSVPRRF